MLHLKAEIDELRAELHELKESLAPMLAEFNKYHLERKEIEEIIDCAAGFHCGDAETAARAQFDFDGLGALAHFQVSPDGHSGAPDEQDSEE
jgi:regulator of replication initiation timing